MPGKTALITGAHGGLGIHVTHAFLDAGFAVVGLAPKILQSDINHASFNPSPRRTRQPRRREKSRRFGHCPLRKN